MASSRLCGGGVVDKNFAAAIYDAFAAAGYYGDDTQTVQEILGEFTGDIDASDRSIDNITGIEWLRNANSIDFSNSNQNPETMNTFYNLEPLSIEYLMQKMGITLQDTKRWYKEDGNLFIDLVGVPIREYKLLAGHIYIEIFNGTTTPPVIESENLVAIKEEGSKSWSVDKIVNLPPLYKDGKQAYYSSDEFIALSYIDRTQTTVNDDVYLNYEKITDNIFEIADIKSSGYIRGIATTDPSAHIVFFKFSLGTEQPAGMGFSYETNLYARIYMPVVAEKIVNSEIKVTKSATSDSSGKKVVGAKYHLYHDDGDSDYENDELVSETVYITDDNGEFYVNEKLAEGQYYLKEFEAPEGFLVNENPIKFNIAADHINVAVSGGDTDFETNAGTIEKDPDTVYFDRYSDDVNVDINVDADHGNDPDYQLESIEITYFDRDSQDDKTLTVTGPDQTTKFASVGEAAQWVTDWINANKGNADDPGVIDSKVEIKVNLKDAEVKELVTSDPRPVTEIDFTKLGQTMDDDGNLSESILPGATFKLECDHRHTDACKDKDGKITYASCIDPHSDRGDYFTEEGCNWNDQATSDEEGNVRFENLNTGTYRMTEISTPEGFVPTKTVWEVKVNAAEGTYTINTKSQDDNSELQGDQEDGYQIINETYFVKVIKIDSETNKKLPGATFGLYKQENGEWSKEPIQTVTTKEHSAGSQDDGGFAVFKNLEEGTYKIKELTAPQGYELLTEEVVFELPFEYKSQTDGVTSEVTTDKKTITFTISNKKGTTPPETGTEEKPGEKDSTDKADPAEKPSSDSPETGADITAGTEMVRIALMAITAIAGIVLMGIAVRSLKKTKK